MSDHYDKLIDEAATALCWAGFADPQSRSDNAKTYWARIAPHARAQYRKEVRAMIAAFLTGWKISSAIRSDFALDHSELKTIRSVAQMTARELAGTL